MQKTQNCELTKNRNAQFFTQFPCLTFLALFVKDFTDAYVIKVSDILNFSPWHFEPGELFDDFFDVDEEENKSGAICSWYYFKLFLFYKMSLILELHWCKSRNGQEFRFERGFDWAGKRFSALVWVCNCSETSYRNQVCLL